MLHVFFHRCWVGHVCHRSVFRVWCRWLQGEVLEDFFALCAIYVFFRNILFLAEGSGDGFGYYLSFCDFFFWLRFFVNQGVRGFCTVSVIFLIAALLCRPLRRSSRIACGRSRCKSWCWTSPSVRVEIGSPGHQRWSHSAAFFPRFSYLVVSVERIPVSLLTYI
jgi:hypothetical protein